MTETKTKCECGADLTTQDEFREGSCIACLLELTIPDLHHQLRRLREHIRWNRKWFIDAAHRKWHEQKEACTEFVKGLDGGSYNGYRLAARTLRGIERRSFSE